MITKQSHPFIWNTLNSDEDWSLIIQRRGKGFKAKLMFDHYLADPEAPRVWGHTAKIALDRLEALLQGKD